jgi:hypothetical protein
MTVLAFVTNEPTAEAIASIGQETMASFAMALTPAEVRQLIDDLSRFAADLPPD